MPGTDYYTLDGLDLVECLLDGRTGDDWKVYLSGSVPSVAVSQSRKITIRSLHRLNAWELAGKPTDPLERNAAAKAYGKHFLEAQAKLDLKPGIGLSGAVRKLAPEVQAIRKNAGINIMARENWTRGGRCEVFRTETDENVRAWDLRSAYAGAYQHSIPGAFIKRQAKVPRGTDKFAALVTIRIPESERYPSAPVRGRNGTLFFPRGEWKGWLMGPEVLHLAELGQIVSVHDVYLFESVDVFSGFVEKMHAFRMNAANPIEKAYAKLLLVAGYGSLATHAEYPIWHLRPLVPVDGRMMRPRLFEVFEKPKASLAHGPAAAWILSKIRVQVSTALRMSDRACYCAIDSVTLPASVELKTGDKPGDWQPGPVMAGGRWVAPGTYSLGGGAVIRASGVERELAADYLSGKEVTAARTCQADGALRMGAKARGIVKIHLRKDEGEGRVKTPGDPLNRTTPIDYHACF